MFFNLCGLYRTQINPYSSYGCGCADRMFTSCGCPSRGIPGPIGPVGPAGPMGPMGPRGATGPTGPAGAAALTDALYASAAGAVTGGAVVPLARTAASPSTTITVSGNAVNLPAGTYIISYQVTGTRAAAGTITVSLYAGGSPIAGETISESNDGTGASTAAKTIVYTAASPVALTLVNGSGDTVTFNSASVTAIRIV